MLAVYLKDLSGYFRTFSGYVFMSVFLLITSIFYITGNVLTNSADYNNTLGSILFIFILVVPILTMRLMTDEVSLKTDRLLYTSPVSFTDIVLGKYFAAVTVFAITLLLTSLYPVSMSFFGNLAVWEIVGGMIGFFLLGCVSIAIGVLISSITDNLISAAIGTFGALLAIMFIDSFRSIYPVETNPNAVFAALLALGVAFWVYRMTRSPALGLAVAVIGLGVVGLVFWLKPELYQGFVYHIFGWFSMFYHFLSFQMGVLALSSIVYYLSFTGLVLFLTVQILEKRRWS
ncbi:MAG: ABC transporter permease [Firmicutes bacterium]|jgi:ABC-2 type transport system permease protein|nr:ABC transporter permease [Bacillota bacterium]NLL87623.1 ABC transporter permease [Bacillota bacterium]HKM17147.1 ABC transporter permease [Limnochordia bacterium]